MMYSQTTNRNSPHFADMIRLFSQGEWVDLPFSEADVAAATTDSFDLKEGRDDCRNGAWQSFTNPEFENESDCAEYYDSQRLDEIEQRGL